MKLSLFFLFLFATVFSSMPLFADEGDKNGISQVEYVVIDNFLKYSDLFQRDQTKDKIQVKKELFERAKKYPVEQLITTDLDPSANFRTDDISKEDPIEKGEFYIEKAEEQERRIIKFKVKHLVGDDTTKFELKYDHELRPTNVVLDLSGVRHASLKNAMIIFGQLLGTGLPFGVEIVHTQFFKFQLLSEKYKIGKPALGQKSYPLVIAIERPWKLDEDLQFPSSWLMLSNLPVEIVVDAKTGGYAEWLILAITSVRKDVKIVGATEKVTETSGTQTAEMEQPIPAGTIIYSGGELMSTDGKTLQPMRFKKIKVD
ncbi:MAG TPA: hypothetical protein VJL87_03630 [Bdellovibrionota bacterium]|nr:hypothetical protein [Bdellovibrionota bacterium]